MPFFMTFAFFDILYYYFSKKPFSTYYTMTFPDFFFELEWTPAKLVTFSDTQLHTHNLTAHKYLKKCCCPEDLHTFLINLHWMSREHTANLLFPNVTGGIKVESFSFIYLAVVLREKRCRYWSLRVDDRPQANELLFIVADWNIQYIYIYTVYIYIYKS